MVQRQLSMQMKVFIPFLQITLGHLGQLPKVATLHMIIIAQKVMQVFYLIFQLSLLIRKVAQTLAPKQ